MSSGWLVRSSGSASAAGSGHDCPSEYSFDHQLANERVPLYYWPAARMWGIPKLMSERIPDGWWEWSPMLEVQFCPWCGEAFPPPLHEELRQALAALGLEPGDSEVPAKFRTDTWWREAGL